jgi:cytoplasmic iron level regulating protein YaaA (DUF328/UPF0246 family)
MIKPIALIACSKKKTAAPGQAHQLYQGQLFKAQLAYAQAVLKMSLNQIFILSAGYGLVRADIEIEPYDVSLESMTAVERSEWAERVWLRLLVPILAYKLKTVYIMAGRLYRDEITPMLVAKELDVITPVPPGLGYARQVKWYREMAREVEV